MTSIVEVKLELGHRAKVREVPLPEGHTHDWVIFVKGSEGVQLEHFVEKVVFWLHESYDQPKRVIKHPPYKVEQSGYAGFNMLIDVHFRNKEDPKMVRFQYDLFLHTEAMPPVNHTRLEKLTFTNPTEDFRKKLLKAGGIPINLSSSHSKDRHERSPGYPSKKDKTKNKEGLKQRERSSSSGRKDQDERKKMSAYIGKKDGRIAGKDMKHHDTEFKQPKDMFNASRIRKESGSEKPEVIERGRSEKRKSLSTEDSGNKKKKRYSEDLSSANSKSKSLIAPSGSTSVSAVNSNKKEKNKKVKENMIEGLFAPGASININQIKQNKDKGKQDGTDVKLKKEKITVPCKRTSSKDSSVPSTSESLSTRYSKVSVGNDLTLKIKKIPSTKSKGKKSSSENAKKLSESNSERKQTKESVLGKAAIDSSCEQQGKKKRPLISPSSSSSSDMDISDEDISKKEKEQEEPKTEKKYNTTTKSKSKIKACEEQAKVSESSLVKKFSRSKTKNKDLAKHTDVNTSLASVERKFKEKLMQKTKTKLNKSGKDDGRRSETLIREEDQSLKKSKKHKHSSKERSHSSFLIKKSRSLTSKIADVPLSEIVPGSEKPKIVSETYPAPGATFLDERNISTKMSDSSKWDRKNSKKSDKGQTSSPESTCKKSKKGYILAQVKTSPNVSSLEVARTTAQSKKTFKSNSFVETSSDEDSEFEYLGDTKSVLEDGKKLSVSSSSSLISHDNSNIDSDVDERHHNDQVHQTSAPSPSSSDEGEISVFPPAEESTLPVISPIADKSISHSANENSLCNDMELSDSSGGSPFKYHRDHTNCTSNIVTFNEIPQGSMNNGLPPFSLQDDISSSTDEDDDASPVQKPFQYQQERNESLHGFIAEHDSNNNDSEQDSAACSRSTSEPMVEVTVGAERKSYPHLTGPLYKELQEIHRKLSYITDVNRLRKIALIVAKSQKTEISPNYFDFDLCSLDHSTIHKIQKHLKAT